MGREEILSRILSDAEAEAAEIVRAAEQRAAEIVRAAEDSLAADRAAAEEEARERARRIKEGRAATARLDGAKVLLAEKRRVIDGIYLRALSSLLALEKHESLLLLGRLLEENAEEGDEVVFAENFPYAEEAKGLPVVKKKNLTVSGERLPIKGGCILRGKVCDTDLSYSALLAADREEHQAEIALAVFGKAK